MWSVKCVLCLLCNIEPIVFNHSIYQKGCVKSVSLPYHVIKYTYILNSNGNRMHHCQLGPECEIIWNTNHKTTKAFYPIKSPYVLHYRIFTAQVMRGLKRSTPNCEMRNLCFRERQELRAFPPCEFDTIRYSFSRHIFLEWCKYK